MLCFEISEIAYTVNYFAYNSGSYKQLIINFSIS